MMMMMTMMIIGVQQRGCQVFGESGTILLAFHRSAGHFFPVLLEDHLVAPTHRQGQGQSERAADRRAVNLYRSSCYKRSFEACEQVSEERH